MRATYLSVLCTNKRPFRVHLICDKFKLFVGWVVLDGKHASCNACDEFFSLFGRQVASSKSLVNKGTKIFRKVKIWPQWLLPIVWCQPRPFRSRLECSSTRDINLKCYHILLCSPVYCITWCNSIPLRPLPCSHLLVRQLITSSKLKDHSFLRPLSMWYILVLPGLQAIPFEMHTSVTFRVSVCVTGGRGREGERITLGGVPVCM